jgi:hypothetical protein
VLGVDADRRAVRLGELRAFDRGDRFRDQVDDDCFAAIRRPQPYERGRALQRVDGESRISQQPLALDWLARERAQTVPEQVEVPGRAMPEVEAAQRRPAGQRPFGAHGRQQLEDAGLQVGELAGHG